MRRPPHAPDIYRSDTVPQVLKERLSKAEGHINATDRKLWMDPDRGLWSARQAVARLSEAWLHLRGFLPELPAAGRSLSSELTRARIDALIRQAGASQLVSAWQEMASVEAAIRALFLAELDRPSQPTKARIEAHCRYIQLLRDMRDAVVNEIAECCVRMRPISHAALRRAIFDALGSESIFDALHWNGAVPDPAIAVRHVSDEVRACLDEVIERDYLDLSVRQDVLYSDLLGTGELAPKAAICSETAFERMASVVTFDFVGRVPLHALEVVGRWEPGACLAALHRLARLVRPNPDGNGGRTTLQWAGLACYHTHSRAPGELPAIDFSGKRKRTLSDEIEAVVHSSFIANVPSPDAASSPKVETFAFDRMALTPSGDGAVTAILIEFSAFPSDPSG
ncbi:MAG TPA: hypothetical protein VHD15_18370 [Hyphomicrobiales bacterium]|nr:hypothetical protein [Hyphomicrobiales bacterium]